MRHKFVMLGLLAALLLAVVSPSFASRTNAAAPAAPVATAAQTHPAILDKTRFLLHAGAGFYAFHHFVWARYKSGGFSASDPHRKSNSKTLQLLVAPLNKLGSSVNTVYTKLKGGQYSDADIQGLNDNISSFGKVSASDGYTIKDRAVPVPGAA